MTDETLLLIGRETPDSRDVIETHAAQLRDRSAVDSVEVVTYERDPERELAQQLAAVTAEQVYAIPMVVAHTRETETDVPNALTHVEGTVEYVDPVGRDPALTPVLAERARSCLSPSEPTSIILCAFGSSSLPYQRRAAEYHATQLRERSDFDEIETSFLLQNPTVECARYTVSNDRVVAVPLFFAHGPATREKIPDKLELARGGIEYADPIGSHSRLTDVLHGAIEKRRVLADNDTPEKIYSTNKSVDIHPVATDGDGRH